MRIVIDEPKRVANLAKHGIDQRDVETEFDFAMATIFPARPSRTGRVRLLAVSWMGGRLVTVVFSPLGSEAIGLVSVRPANRSERQAHVQ